jgi:hypothetical protein
MWLVGLAYAGESQVCTTYAETDSPITVQDAPEIQSSGIAEARSQPGRFFTHDDAGGEPILHVFERTDTGAVYVAPLLVSGATNTDWEDIASGPCPAAIDSDSCLWIADIGDNDDLRSSIDVWVIADTMQAGGEVAHCPLVYEDGDRFDAEALFVTPDGTLRIVTKEKDGEAKIYRLSNPVCDGGAAQTLTREAEIFPGEEVTGAAVNYDGTAVVLRSLNKAWLWTGCDFAWSDPPLEIDLGAQPQGEAITFLADGTLVTTSEGSPLRLWETPCAETEALDCPECGCDGDGALIFLLVPLGAWRRRRSSVPG